MRMFLKRDKCLFNVFLTGQPSGGELGKPIGQDSSLFGTDLVKIFEPVTLFSARLDRTDQLEMMLPPCT
ncbi:hypothetical protein ABFG93_05560 [Pseudalkalibacillus hwajinpoensis]|uniref:hypothetical protein n=1 Tax=Guptibacillus hwajinpoensis TaxID=208199 RepID=UPI00325AB189